MQAISRPEGGGAILPISEIRTLGAYQDDWEAVSHNFEFLPDCSGHFSILLERPAMEPVEEQKGRSADKDPGPKISHAAIEANTNPTTAIAKPAKPITAHPPMPSCQGSPRRLTYRSPRTSVIVLTSYHDDEHVFPVIQV